MKKTLLLALGAMIMLAGVSSFLRADSLHLKNGQWVEGTYLGGNNRTIRFGVAGTTRTYYVNDVDQIQFSNGAISANRFVTFDTTQVRMNRPADWQVIQSGDSWTITPRNGRIRERNGSESVAYGVTIDVFQPASTYYRQQFQSPNGYGLRRSLGDDTNMLIDDLRQSNRNMRTVGVPQNIRVDGQFALSTRLTNDSPLGGQETNWLITMQRPDGLLYLIFTAPDREFDNYETVFQQMLDSIRLNR